MKQIAVSDALRHFADALDSNERERRVGKFDPTGEKLAAFCDALGKMASQVGVTLRAKLLSTPTGPLGLQSIYSLVVDRQLTDELRRFADVIDKKRDAVRKVDPGYKRLADVVPFIRMYCADSGIDIGLGFGTFSIGKKIGGRR